MTSRWVGWQRFSKCTSKILRPYITRTLCLTHVQFEIRKSYFYIYISVEYGLEHILRVINNFVLCWKLCDTLITLNLIDIYERFRLSIHNQTSTYVARVISPQIWHCSTLLTTGPATGRCVFLSNKARVVSGS